MQGKFFCCLVSVGAISTAGIAAAQSLEEITVTARKTEESLQDVPLAITAIGSEEIERLGIKGIKDIVRQDTSVQFDEGFTPSDTRITIRGLSPTRGRPNNATLVDGIDVGSEAVSNPGGSTLVSPRLLDVQRIEIVKGPQSALYGRSAFAGAIQYVTKDPEDTLVGTLAVDANSSDDRELRGSLSIPLNDTLGALVNGYVWDSRGYYRNSVTGAYIAGGKGSGMSLTLKWEPADNLDFKWRTEYTDDETAPTAQVGLNGFNRYVDLGSGGNLGAPGGNIGPSNIAPNSSNCFIGVDGQGTPNPGPGPLANPGCFASQFLNEYFANNLGPTYTDPIPGYTPNLGQYDPSNPDNFNQYNRQVINTFFGEVPNGKKLRATLNPNYLWGPGASIPNRAIDFPGTDKEVFRTSLVANWRPSDALTFTSYTAYTDANVAIQQDIGRFYIDRCSPDVAALASRPDPTGTYGSYLEALTAQGISNVAAFAPCNPALGSDGVNDAKGAFTQDDVTETTQFSQELRMSWQLNEDWNATTGLLYWREDTELTDRNLTLITGGTQCFITQLGATPYRDGSQAAGINTFLQLDPIQDQCGTTLLPAAYWAAKSWEARGENPGVQERDIRHYSWYGSLEWNITDRWTTRVEARYTREDNSVVAPVMTPCLNGEPANQPGNPDSCITGGAPDRNAAGAGGQPTGPSTVVICGQTGRCDYLGIAPISGSPWYGQVADNGEFSWWPYGYAPMLSYQASPPKRRDRYWTPKATVEFAPLDDVLTYFSWSRGIKPGGYSLLTIGAFGLDPNLDGVFEEAEFEPERLDVWEVGFKSTLFDGRVRLNGAVFFQDFKDKQISTQKVIGNTTGIVTENISGSEVRGLELDVTWQATANWLLSGGYTYLDTEFTNYTLVTNSATTIGKESLGPRPDNCQQTGIVPGSNPDNPRYGCVVSFNGNQLENAPEHAFLANAIYRNSLFDTGLEWYGEVNFRYQSKRYIEPDNAAILPSYSLTNLRLGITAEIWDAQIYVNNVFDDRKIQSGGPTVGIPNANFVIGLANPPQLGSPNGIIAGPSLPQDIYVNLPDPRIVGVRANWRFGN